MWLLALLIAVLIVSSKSPIPSPSDSQTVFIYKCKQQIKNGIDKIAFLQLQLFQPIKFYEQKIYSFK